MAQRARALLSLAVSMLFLAGPVSAQGDRSETTSTDTAALPDVAAENDEPENRIAERAGIDEIVVTAEKREQAIQDVPTAITAFNTQQLLDQGIENVDTLAFNTPNFHYGSNQGSARITIRGVSTSGGDQAAAFHIDGIYQNDALIPAALTFFDIERVEVLRGPQGTLYGRNATGGSVNVITKSPSYDFEAFGDIQLGTYDLVQSRGVLNVPIVQDKVAARLSFLTNNHRGYQQNLEKNDRSQDYDDANQWAVRGQLRFEPIEDLDIVVRTSYAQNNRVGFGLKQQGDYPPPTTVINGMLGGLDLIVTSDPYAGATPNPDDARRIYLDFTGETAADSIAANAEVTYHLPPAGFLGDTNLTLIGAFSEQDIFNQRDLDLSNRPTVDIFSNIDNREYVFEAHWASENGGEDGIRGDLQWQMGVFYLNSDRTAAVDVPTNIPFDVTVGGADLGSLPLMISFESSTTRQDQSAAVYGQIDYTLWDDFLLTGGIRYSHDWKDLDFFGGEIRLLTSLNPPGLPPIPLNLCIQPEHTASKSNDWGAVSGKLGIQYRIDDEHNVYATFSPGYKSGFVNADSPPPLSNLTIDGACNPYTTNPDAAPEKILAFEAGSKNRFFDNRLQANVTAFYYDYDDLQVSTLVQSNAIIDNAAEARLFGFELELQAVLFDDLQIVGNFAYLNAKFTSYPNALIVEDPTARPDFSGNTMPRAPEFSGNIAVMYNLDLDRFGLLRPRIHIFASDKVFFAAANLPRDTQDAYWLLNLRLHWFSPDERFWVEGFIDNVLDKDVQNYKALNSSLLGSPLMTGYEAPRTAGVRVGVNW